MQQKFNTSKRFEMPEVELPIFKNQDFIITTYGAIGTGVHVNTDAIDLAITACAESGGGRVVIPRGLWLTGPIQMKSNVNLHLEEGALVTFSKNYEDYPLILSNYEGYETLRCMAPIYGKDLENMAITGKGIFDGSGDVWRPVKRMKMTDKQWTKLVHSGGIVEERSESDIWWPTEMALEGKWYCEKLQGKCLDSEQCQKYREFFRPVLLSLTNCRMVLLDGPTFQNSPAWCLHPRLCEHITMRNITVRNPWHSSNGDGVDIESCKYVNLSDSVFDVGDDAICIKSGKNEEGRGLGKPSEYISIENCIVYHGHGGFVIGSEMSGGVRNIQVRGCTFIGTDTGLRFKSCLGRGGLVENIYVEEINMKDIANEAIIFSMGYSLQSKAGQEISQEDIPEFRDIHIKDVKCTGAGIALLIEGLSEMPVHSLHMDTVLIRAKKGIFCKDGRDIHLNEVEIQSELDPEVKFHSDILGVIVDNYETQF